MRYPKSSEEMLLEVQIVTHLLITLPSSYEGLTVALEDLSEDKLTLDLVKIFFDEKKKTKSKMQLQ